jgi:hypothetical protein
MNSIKKLALAASAAAVGMCAAGGTAQAAFPNYTDCPRADPAVLVCVDIQSRSGSLTIKGFTVPIGESLNIRGGLRAVGTGAEFVGANGTNGFFARPIQVPGGILGIDFPIPGNAVTATATLVGPASGIKIRTTDFGVETPVKLKLSNPLIGSGCQIGSDSNPVVLRLITGTTNPPPPATPISGRIGRPDLATKTITGNVNVDNTFGIPGASRCGLGLGLINGVINLKLGLPSAAGNNEMIVVNDVGLIGSRVVL